MADVLVIGELNMDLILAEIQKFPELEKEVIANKLNFTLGSSSAIFASNLSSMGSKVAFSGMIGNDFFGEKVLDALKEKNVNTDSIVSSDKYQTGVTVAMNFGDERAMVTHPGAMNYFGNSNVSDQLLKSVKHLHISSIFLQRQLNADLMTLLKRAKSFGLTVSIDPQWDPSEKWELDLNNIFEYIDVFLPNAAEWLALTKSTNIEESLLKYKTFKVIIVVKNGAEGAYCLGGGEVIFQPAFVCHNYIDAIGAGDSFDAGFINLFMEQKQSKECLKNACLMGALNTTASGGVAAFKSKSHIAMALKNYFNQNT
jgi:sugar/nucleoside kinase (ribokinase family)